MAKSKLQRMREVSTFANVFELPMEMRGLWRERYFRNDGDITLELACGRGEYCIALAQRRPEQNFIGIDIKGARLWYGAQQALSMQLANVAFIRTAIENLDLLFAEGEIAEIWIPFPDPHRTFSRRHHRLTSPRFLQMYRRILSPGGVVHLKTDDDVLFQYTLMTLKAEGANILRCIKDVVHEASDDEVLMIKSDYEIRHIKQGKTIKYLAFCFSG